MFSLPITIPGLNFSNLRQSCHKAKEGSQLSLLLKLPNLHVKAKPWCEILPNVSFQRYTSRGNGILRSFIIKGEELLYRVRYYGSMVTKHQVNYFANRTFQIICSLIIVIGSGISPHHY